MSYRRKGYEELRGLAAQFLAQHHPDGSIPVPIETIVEFKLDLQIMPVPGLQEEFNVEGYLALGRQAIVVDEWVMTQRKGRYRFTLAYETGRHLLQKDLVPSDIETPDDLVEWHESMSDKTIEDAKFEVFDFGGLVLVPPNHLQREFNRCRQQVDQAMGRTRWAQKDHHWLVIVDELAKRFDVSADVVKHRIRRDELLPNGVRI